VKVTSAAAGAGSRCAPATLFRRWPRNFAVRHQRGVPTLKEYKRGANIGADLADSYDR
jgi:hypothetical protein